MKETDIRPANLTDIYLKMSADDASRFFVGERIATDCVGCGATNSSEFSFSKNGFDFALCGLCHTLYLNPRPKIEEFNQFYSDSPSSKFWAEEFFPALMMNRRELIFVPRVKMISEICAAKKLRPGQVIDVGAGHGVFLEEWAKLYPESRLMAIEPGDKLAAICRDKGFEVLQTMAEDAHAWTGKGDLTVCFEVVEHAHTPLHFVQSLFNLTRPGGYSVVTGLGVEGFDILSLWENSKSVWPPHHINFLSVKGFERLFERAGFTEVEVVTPGKLDVDIVSRQYDGAMNSASEARFTKALLSRGEEAKKAFQVFLSTHRLSSHVWVSAKRPFEA